MAETIIDGRMLMLVGVALCSPKPRFTTRWVKVGTGLKLPAYEEGPRG